ncbi:MAG: hypothetical protein K8F60_03770 [Melioribacteraceae bacterium]|nr:hypothetical protein [Melioribacteraceae bacterium]
MKRIIYYIIGGAVIGLLAGVILIDLFFSALLPGMFGIFSISTIFILIILFLVGRAFIHFLTKLFD